MSDFWRQWENQVIDGRFPLRRFLAESSHSAVFLTEHTAQRVDAAIKFIRADPSLAGMQLARWRAAAALSHPHLIRLIETGHCRLGNHELLFVVMEYAEQTLAQVLAVRALTFDEVRQLSEPTLSALSFLHRSGWVHGQVKPPNVCVVNDELKLASDTLRPAGDPLAGSVDPSPFDAPEEKGGGASAAGDIWGLGMTLVAALNQQPAVSHGPSQPLPLPSTVPPEFAEALGRCLSPDPGWRPTATELQVQIGPVDRDPPASPPQANDPCNSMRGETPTVSAEIAAPRLGSSSTFRRSISPARVVGGVILLSAAVWGGMRLMQGRAAPGPELGSATVGTPRAPSAPGANPEGTEPAFSQSVSRPVGRPLPQVVPPSDAVLHEEIPAVPASALKTIRGRIQVLVSVSVDASGHVIDVTLEHSGSSKYFARAAAAAARKWRFAPAAEPGTRKWLLRLEFTPAGVSAHVPIATRR